MAYRSRSRPSSTLGAKASTVCPYYLDGDQARHDLAVLRAMVIPVFSRRLSMAADVASVQFSRTVERLYAGRLRVLRACLLRHVHAISRRAPVSQNSTACWGRFAPREGRERPRERAPEVGRELAPARSPQPGSVDMLGPVLCRSVNSPSRAIGIARSPRREGSFRPGHR